ncbi:hypothetical protein GIB67_030217 [Kingdonia uniflora]|uniref:At4g14310 8-bladed propeller domain-containing protein n=1 Tax=Kingdonia uniflora TaxID=39325 RepID=A0A7J7MN32_9MAGN|nr:hypothetical protein GIB67_030217 [Kingdonia uniflora]
MSTATVRRVKERGGGGGKITALKPSKTITPTPISAEKDNNVKPSKTLIHIGKENPNPREVPLMCQKPLIRPIPPIAAVSRVEKKPVGGTRDGGDSATRARWSTTSRGRSSSPSDFAKVLSDRMSRVAVTDRSGGRSSGKFGVSGLERSQSQSQSQKSNFNLKSNDREIVEKCEVRVSDWMENSKKKEINCVTVNGNCKGEVTLKHDGVLKSANDKCNSFVSSNEVRYLNFGVKNKVEEVSKGGKEKALHNLELVNKSKEKSNSEESKDTRPINKYPSKLHEKLAFLEGKVKRIASDIKRTKDMLDMNNPDSSKMILTDIQDKISGIENAMGHVVNDNQGSEIVVVSQTKKVEPSKKSVKGLNHEELEERLFPHHKLLRNRTSSSTSSTSTQNKPPVVPQTVLLSPIDENPIALEFLASLDGRQSNVSSYKRGEHARLEFSEIQEMESNITTSTTQAGSNTLVDGNSDAENRFTADETIEDFDDQENKPEMVIVEETEDTSMDQVNEIGYKIATGGWFVSEGESILLAHDDGSCSFYDIANTEEKAVYNPPSKVSPNLWGDCWLIRAPGSDGCSGRYVVAASSGNSLESGFCVWDFYTKVVRSFHIEDATITSSSRTILGPLPSRGAYRRNALSTITTPENCQWWYKPCGPLIVSTASCQRVVKIFDVRDGEQVMKWEVQRPVVGIDYSSPLQWRNRGKIVVAETDAISLWDVNSLSPQALLSVALSGRKLFALHVNNTDAESGGGVRRRVSSSEVEGNDGVFCTEDTINVLDFRLPSGVGLKISKYGATVHSVFSRGDSIFLGCKDGRLALHKQVRSSVQQFSLRKGRLLSTYALPDSNAHAHCSAVSQVWGNSDLVAGVCGLGLFVFDASEDEFDNGKAHLVRDIIGPDDLYSPSFDYSSSRVLVISKDRPALWRYLS